MESKALKSQPNNSNLAQTTRFQLTIPRLQGVSYFCQTFILPGVTAGNAMVPTPFVDMPVPGEKLQYDPLTVTFLVDEDMSNWREVHTWMRGYTFPTDFKEYRDLRLQNQFTKSLDRPQYSDGQLTVFSNAWKPLLRFKFYNMFPTTLGSVNFTAQDTPDAIMMADVTFMYLYFDVEYLG